MSDIDNEFDFGFSFEDVEPVIKVASTTTEQSVASNDQLLALQEKIDALLDTQEQTLQSALIKVMEEKNKAKLKEIEGLILPLLYNLMKNPEKPMIKWENREPVIKKQIEKILAVTRG